MNVEATEHLLQSCQTGGTFGRVRCATSLGAQGMTFDHVILCLPLDLGLWTSFHLEPHALLGMMGRTRVTLYLLRPGGAMWCELPGRREIASLLRWWEEGAG